MFVNSVGEGAVGLRNASRTQELTGFLEELSKGIERARRGLGHGWFCVACCQDTQHKHGRVRKKPRTRTSRACIFLTRAL